jgi:uncharacterized lipoprotein YbaY
MKRFKQQLLQSVACLAFVHIVMFCLTGCASSGGAGDPLTIRGEFVSRERIALPAEGVGLVELARTQDGRVIAEVRLPLAGRQLPVPFELKAHRSALEDRATYFLRGAIAFYGRTQWISDVVEVRERPGTIEIGPLALKRYEPAAFSSPLLCGNQRASVGVARVGQREILQLTIGGERFELYETVTASGARYEAVNDHRTFVWFKGQRATLTVRGESYPECIVAD